MWDLYSYRLLNHITPSPTHPPVYVCGVYITVTYLTNYIWYSIYVPPPHHQPARDTHLTQTVRSVTFKFLSPVQRLFTPDRGVVVSTWQVEPMGLQKRRCGEEVPVLTTNSLRFICHPLEVNDKKTHRGEMEVLVKKNETFLDSVYTSIPNEATSLQSDRHITSWT